MDWPETAKSQGYLLGVRTERRMATFSEWRIGKKQEASLVA